MLTGPDKGDFQFLALPNVVAPETVQAALKNLSLRGWQIADRWALGAPDTVKAMEMVGTLIPSLKEQQKLEAETISDARVGGRMQDIPDSEILALQEIPSLPVPVVATDYATFTVIAIDMFHAWDRAEDLEVTGFRSLEDAREYARRRTRDSVEEMRAEVNNAEELPQRWRTFGEDCVVVGGGYVGSSELDYFISEPATPEQRDWVSLTPYPLQAVTLRFPEQTSRKFSPAALKHIEALSKNDPLMKLSYVPGPKGEAVFDPELCDAVHGLYPWKNATLAERQAAIDEAWADGPHKYLHDRSK